MPEKLPVAAVVESHENRAECFLTRVSSVYDMDEKLIRQRDVKKFSLDLTSIAVQVVEEQMKVLAGVVGELEARKEIDGVEFDDHLNEQVEQLQYAVSHWPKELQNELREEISESFAKTNATGEK